MTSFECHESLPANSPKNNAIDLSKDLDAIETDPNKQRLFAEFAEENYGATAIENDDGTFSVISKNHDKPVPVVQWYRNAISKIYWQLEDDCPKSIN